MRPPANETFSRWLCQGVPLLIGVGIVGAFALHFNSGLRLSKIALPIAVLLGIQVLFYVSMYLVRKQYRKTRDLRIGAIVGGMYGLFIGLAGMYYAGQIGVASPRTFEDNYFGFPVFMGVVTCIVVVFFSFVKPKPNSQVND